MRCSAIIQEAGLTRAVVAVAMGLSIAQTLSAEEDETTKALLDEVVAGCKSNIGPAQK